MHHISLCKYINFCDKPFFHSDCNHIFLIMGPLMKVHNLFGNYSHIGCIFSHMLYPICVSQYFIYNFLFQRISLHIILAMLKKHIPMGYHPLFLILLSIIILWLKTCSISIFHTAVAALTDYIAVAQGLLISYRKATHGRRPLQITVVKNTTF